MRKLLALAIGLGFALLPSCQCEPVHEEERSGSFTADPQVGGLLEVAQYQVTLREQEGVTVVLVGKDGAPRGQMTMAPSTEEETVWTFKTPEGQQAVLHTLQAWTAEGNSWNRFRFEAEGSEFQLEMIADTSGNPLHTLLATRGDEPDEDGTLRRRPDDFNHVLELPLDGSVSRDETLTWLKQAHIQPLLDSRAALMLTLLTLDQELLKGFAQLSSGEQPKGQTGAQLEALHKSIWCTSGEPMAAAYLVTKAGAQCASCLTKLTAAIVSEGLGALLAGPDCVTCMSTAIWPSVLFTVCSLAQDWAKTDAVCQSLPTCPKGYDSKADAKEHHCLCICNKDLCADRYKAALKPGEVLCKAGCEDPLTGGPYVCEGTVSRCGDGKIQGASMGCAEQCDPKAMPTGCTGGKQCNAQCLCVDPPDAGTQCPPSCRPRTTLAGCTDSACDEACVCDAPDAGSDPGTPDAGPPDAGESDAGSSGELCGQSFCNPGDTCLNCGAPVCVPAGAICCPCNCGTGGSYLCPVGAACGSGNTCTIAGMPPYNPGACGCGDF